MSDQLVIAFVFLFSGVLFGGILTTIALNVNWRAWINRTKWRMGNAKNLHKWKITEIDPPDTADLFTIGKPIVPKKFWVIQDDGTVWVTENFYDVIPHWERETDQDVIDRLTSPGAEAVAIRNTTDMFWPEETFKPE